MASICDFLLCRRKEKAESHFTDGETSCRLLVLFISLTIQTSSGNLLFLKGEYYFPTLSDVDLPYLFSDNPTDAFSRYKRGKKWLEKS